MAKGNKILRQSWKQKFGNKSWKQKFVHRTKLKTMSTLFQDWGRKIALIPSNKRTERGR